MPLSSVIMRVLHGSRAYQLLQNPSYRSAKTNWFVFSLICLLEPILQMTGWLPMEYRVQQLKLGHMFKVFHKEAPSYLLGNIRLVREHHAYITRSSVHNFILPGINSAGKNCFYYTGAKIWNSLPAALKSITSLSHRKQCVRLHLLDKVWQQGMSDFIHFNIFYLWYYASYLW